MATLIILLFVTVIVGFLYQQKKVKNIADVEPMSAASFRTLMDDYHQPAFEPKVTPTPGADGVPWWLKQRDKTDYAQFGLEKPTEMVFDVRPESDYNAGHLAGAFNLPIHIILSGTYEIPADIRVVFYGDTFTDNRSAVLTSLYEHGVKTIELVDIPFNVLERTYAIEKSEPNDIE